MNSIESKHLEQASKIGTLTISVNDSFSPEYSLFSTTRWDHISKILSLIEEFKYGKQNELD